MNNINKGSTFERSEQSPTIWAAPQFDDLNRVDNMLGKPEERHRTILEGIEEGYVEVDLKGSTVFCNDSFCRITGYSKKELIGLNFREYVTESRAEAVYKAYNKVYRTRIPNKAFYYEIIQKNGTKKIIENLFWTAVAQHSKFPG